MRHLTFLLILATCSVAQADMLVDRSIVIFEPGQAPREDVRVSNNGDDVMYVQVDAFAVENPGTEDEARIKITNPQEHKLVASPNKLVIPANGHKLVRLLNLDPKSVEERVYRVNVTPVVPPLAEDTSQLRIVVAYQILVIIQPQSPQSTLEVTRQANEIRFENRGNTNVLLSDGRQCASDDPENCTDLPSHRVYAGTSWSLELPHDAPLSYSVRDFEGIRNEVFP